MYKNVSLKFQQIMPGTLTAVVIAMAAQFLSEHYGAPSMLMALLLGIAFHFLSEEEKCVKGVNFAAKNILRTGVALLGARISFDLLIALGGLQIAFVVAAVALTILFGVLCARALGHDWIFGLLTGGAVAICGASAALAISAVLPRHSHSERNLIFTVLGVTVLSTIAMIFYPVISQLFDFNYHQAGLFLGGTIHDVAQVVGAGFSISPETGETATLVKLIRVVLLAPVVLGITLFTRMKGHTGQDTEARPPLIPGFVLGFLALAVINSTGILPAGVASVFTYLSRWALLIAIAAVGMKTSLKKILDVGKDAILLIVLQTLFIAGLILSLILYEL